MWITYFHTKLKFFDRQYGFWRSEVAFYGDIQVKGQVSQKTLRWPEIIVYHNLSVTGIGPVNPAPGVFTPWAKPERTTTLEQLAYLVFVRNCLYSNTILMNLFSWVTLQNYIFNMSVCVPKEIEK